MIMPEIVIDNEDAEDKKYTLTGKDTVVRQPVDRTTWEKWDGFWKPPIKFIDSYSLRLNGVKLDARKMERFVLKPWAGIHTFKVLDVDVKEVCFSAEDENGFISVLEIKNNSHRRKNVEIILEAGIDMREDFESVHGREYLCDFDKVRSGNHVSTTDKKWNVFYGVGKIQDCKITNTGREKYDKVHRKDVFVPKRISVDVNIDADGEVVVPFIFCGDSDGKNNVKTCFDNVSKHWDKMLADKERKYNELKIEPNYAIKSVGIKTPDEKINKAFFWSLANISDFGRRTNPAKSEIDVKSILWSVLGLVEAGKFSKAREILDDISSFKDGEIPSRITSDNTVIYDSADVNPLFLIALDRYVKQSGDKNFEKNLHEYIINLIRRSKLKDGLAKDLPKVSILDPVFYDDTRIELQSLWTEALKTYHPPRCSAMNSALDVYFWDNRDKFLKDTLREDAPKSANVLVPLFFDHVREIKRDRVLTRIRQEFISEHGVRTRGVFDPGFKAGFAEFGAARCFATGLAATAFFNGNDIGTGLKLLKILSRQMFNYELGIFQEVVNSSTGVPLSLFDSTETSGLFIHAVDSGVFGIGADTVKKEINLSPKFVDEWLEYERFGKAIGEHSLHIKVNRKHERFADIIFNFDSRPDMRVNIELPDEVEWMEINKAKYDGNKVTLQPGKNNRIWAYYRQDTEKIVKL